MHDGGSALREWLHRLRATLTRRRTDGDLEEELRSHLELAAEDARRRGRNAGREMRVARVEAGGAAQAMEALRAQRGLPVLEDLVRDLRYGLRTLRRSPTFTAVAALTLALGISANAAVYQLLEAIRFRTLPVKAPEELVVLGLADTSRWEGRRTTGYPALTNALWEELRDQQRILAGVLAWSNASLHVDQGTTPQDVRGLFVSGDFFKVLGVEPLLGRVFTAADDHPGCSVPGVVVSHGFWQRQFGGDPAVIGQTIGVEGRRLEVIGVTPPGFFGVEVGRSYDVAVPICAEEGLGSEKGWLRDGTIWWLTVMGRMPSGLTLAQLNARLAASSPGLFKSTLPEGHQFEYAAGYLSLTLRAESASRGISALRTRFTDPLLMLAGVAGLVLLIVCTNLGSLVLARASTRQREFAVRQSLGASRTRLVQQVMVENLLLAVAGAVLGLLLAGTLSRLLVELLDPGASLPLRIDARLIGVVTLAVVLIALVFGFIPAWRASRSGALESIRNAAVRGSSASAGLAFRRVLVVSQVAVSLVLLFGALLFVETLGNLLAVETGFQPDGVAVARIDFSRATVPVSDRALFKHELLERIINTPGVRAAAEVRHVPMSGTGSRLTVWLDGSGPHPETTVRLNAIGEGYLRTMGIQLLSGRDFAPNDSATSPRVAIVNRAFARHLGIAGNPVGARFRAKGSSGPGSVFEIVGLVPDTKYFSLREDFLPIVFVPVTQITDPRAFADFVIQPRVPMGDLASALRRRLRETHSSVDVVDVRALDSAIRQGLVRERLLAAISAFFGVLAVLIAAVGLYGVMAELVTRRRGEIGVRMALGARRTVILAMILRQAGTLLLVGVAAGGGLAFLAAGLARPFVFGLEPHDPRLMVLAALSLAAPAMMAILVPAFRAARVEPLAALREE